MHDEEQQGCHPARVCKAGVCSGCKASAPESHCSSITQPQVRICKSYQHKDTETEEAFVEFHMHRLPETMRKGKCHLKG